MKCGACGTEVAEGETVCSHCKVRLSVPEPDRTAGTPDPLTELGDGDRGEPKILDEAPAVVSEPLSPLEQLLADDRPPTIALIGRSEVGKSFYFRRLHEEAHRRGGALDELLPDGQTRPINAEGSQPWDRTVSSTGNFAIYQLRHHRKGGDVRTWIVDMRGEDFRQALDDRFRLNEAEQRRKFWLVMGAADIFMLMSPASESLGRTHDDVLDRLSRGFRSLSAAIQLASKRPPGVDLATAVRDLSALPENEVDKKLLEQEGRCRKPLLLLLSKADEFRFRLAENGDWRVDEDPAGIMAKSAPALLKHLLAWFAYFKVDFVTACDGHDGTSTIDLENKPGFGVSESMQWALTMSRRAANARMAPLYRTELAYKMRSLVNLRFAAALNRR